MKGKWEEVFGISDIRQRGNREKSEFDEVMSERGLGEDERKTFRVRKRSQGGK